jgi:hypothetical protein
MKLGRFHIKTLMIAVAVAALWCGVAVSLGPLRNRSGFEIVLILVVVYFAARLLLSINGPQWVVMRGRLVREDRAPPRPFQPTVRPIDPGPDA